MSWGNSYSADLNAQGRKFSAADGKAFSKIGSRKSAGNEEFLIKKPIVLDMGEASREQGFRLNGCR